MKTLANGIVRGKCERCAETRRLLLDAPSGRWGCSPCCAVWRDAREAAAK